MTAPKARIFKGLGNHKPDPTHHNYNRSQPFNTRLSARLSWMSLTLVGNSANIFSSVQQLQAATRCEEFRNLPESVQVKLAVLTSEARTLAARCKELSDDVKEFNANKRYYK